MTPIYRPGLGDETGRRIEVLHGWLEYRYGPGKTCELVHIQVDEGQRSKGIGREMISRLVKDPEIQTLFGFVQEHNVRVQNFYRNQGFTLTHLPDYYGRGNHAYIVHKFLEKS